MDAWSSSKPLPGTAASTGFMSAVYRWMAFGLALTGLVAYGVYDSPAARQAIFGTPLFLVLILAQLGIVFAFNAILARASFAVATGMFLLYCALTGATLSSILMRYTGESVASTLFVTGGAFLGLSIFGTTTKRNLSAMGSFLTIGVIGLLLAMVVNLFLHSTAVQFVISCAGVLIFAGLTAYDTQRIAAMANTGDERMALRGALRLYLDFINLFLFLLQLFGGRRRRG